MNANPSLVGKRQVDNFCTACCSDDYCNRNCSTALLHSTHIQTTTPAPVGHTSLRTTSASATLASSTTTAATTTTTTTSTTTPVPTTQYTVATTTYPTVVFPIPSGKCRSMGYTLVAGAIHLCYKLHNETRLPWQQARDVCHKEGGELIQFTSTSQSSYFDNLLKGAALPVDTGYWVGAGDSDTEGKWVWLNGSAVSPSHFHTGQPNNAGAGQDCGLLVWSADNKVMLSDADCRSDSYFICQMRFTDPTHHQVSCRNSDYVYYHAGNVCYKVYTNVVKTFQDARKVCQTHFGDLLMLANRNAELYFKKIHELVHAYNHRYWLGATNHADSVFQWLNGEPVGKQQYIWRPGEPNNYLGNEHCLSLMLSRHYADFALNDDDCHHKQQFICEVNREDHRYWLGATNFRTSGSYDWLNGEPVGINEYIWQPGEPNNYHSNEHCLTLTMFNFNKNVFALNDDNCQERKYFICEEKCPDPTYIYLIDLDLCIKLYDQNLTWPNARVQCLHDNADLVVIDTPEKLAYFQHVSSQAVNKAQEIYWIGASDTTNNGAHDFMWVNGDGLASADTSWHAGEPSHATPIEDCVALWWYNSDNALKFNDASCLNETARFICQIKHLW